MTTSATTPLTASGPNADQIDYWNGDAGERWARYQDKLDAMLQPFSGAVLELAAIKPGERLMDIGCGCGATTFEAAEHAGPAGHALGVDISAPMIARARKRAEERAKTSGGHAEFMLADAATHDFGANTFDLLVSRFGIMFFADPVAAFSHMKPSLGTSGRIAFVCWRPMKENGWVSVPFFAALPHLPPQEPPLPGAPGPFAFADPDRFRSILEDAGYRDIAIEPFDASLSLGRGDNPVEAALEQTLEIGPLSRALKELPNETKTRAADAVREALAGHVSNGEVRLGGAVWLVSARA
ncbi:class I SAM-dependent methyltransferase [Parvibaculum sp.]|jgi:SAM-dependent methyltransferase|uniref:class I SAM-dependent methyltransferase n=1 Tax=Parvibaculum sp. TaxID=2024848 RepID=UPI000C5C4EA7|nr:class I SAM-dependent methyltransferase [Parvibaculum sp.]MAM94328.1 SAM-dependent methyltransferase [Parvibaculum sp.]|tara:strand:- start:57001 stop:57891 length:891 start_codon:yes stop_codon:yes gene_type:complete